MSGGSYNYLLNKTAEELTTSVDDLERMTARLTGLGYADDAAEETYELILLIRQYRVRAQKIAERLHDVWHAVEWWDSYDSGEDGVKEAIKEYREGRG